MTKATKKVGTRAKGSKVTKKKETQKAKAGRLSTKFIEELTRKCIRLYEHDSERDNLVFQLVSTKGVPFVRTTGVYYGNYIEVDENKQPIKVHSLCIRKPRGTTLELGLPVSGKHVETINEIANQIYGTNQ